VQCGARYAGAGFSWYVTRAAEKVADGGIRTNANGTLRCSYLSSTFATGDGPYSVALGDFNRDGAPDLVTANLEGDDVSILLGCGDGTFGAPEQAAAGPEPRAVAASDFNRDGRLDVAVAGCNSGSATVSVLLNDGNWPATSPVLPGDYNVNGVVDAADYVVWCKTPGTGVPNLTAAEGNRNGAVDAGDDSVWRSHFGQYAGSGAAGYPLCASVEPLPAAVPEPPTAIPFFAAAVAAAFVSRSSRGGNSRP
jgi:hypothetical protein